MAKLHDPSELTFDDLTKLIREIQEALWPDGDWDHEWDSGTMQKVADAVTQAGLGPDYEND